MDIKLLLWDFRYVIAFGILCAVYAVLNWPKVKVDAYSLMLQAKRAAKKGYLSGGKEQERWVVKKLYPLLPFGFKLFISEDQLVDIVNDLYIKSKDFLDDGEFNNSITE